MGRFFAAIALYIGNAAGPDNRLLVSLLITLAFVITQLVSIQFFEKTPIELLEKNKPQDV